MIINEIENVLDKHVRPKLSQHYGDVRVISFEDGVVVISLMGQCKNCPSAQITVETIIESEIKKHIPEVSRVLLVNNVSDDLLDFAKKVLSKKLKG
ncbi:MULTISPECIES: NifU family protein [unclassified Sedimentibacter]|uniref:NifU family protein n=1 Tax=unclassified Sedimentibacter TaxID=2649220 RepID=UPI0027E0F03B|nr:NifU family protein [Sedimentibacter sp. MB35-C1]WMJ78773.1 NifU family protein [Sedimentibacter sp. MB35-C1]